VICEKPLAPTPQTIKKMIQAAGQELQAADDGSALPVRGSRRRLGGDRRVRLGNIYHARSWMLRRSGADPSRLQISESSQRGGPCIDIGVPYPGR